MSKHIKPQLYALCSTVIKQRIDNAQHALNELQQASENETKSSAGDKYETSREMIQQETDRAMQMLNEAKKQMTMLSMINPSGSSLSVADNGSLVKTDKGNFYLSISAGTLSLDNDKYFAVSIASPVGVKLRGMQAGESFSLNGSNYQILEIV